MGKDSLRNEPARALLRWSAALVVFAVFACFLLLLIGTQDLIHQQYRGAPRPDRVAPFVATRMPVVLKMLQLANVKPTDTVYDLGSGDGRIVIAAARTFGARAVGVELDDKLFQESTAQVAELGLNRRATIVHANMFDTDLRPATVVTLFLWEGVNERLRPMLERELRPGARVVTNRFPVPGWKPANVVSITTEDGASHTLYLYVRPL